MRRDREPPEDRAGTSPDGATSEPSEIADSKLRDALAMSQGGGREVDLEAVQRALGGGASPDELRALIDRLSEEPELAEAWRLGVHLRRELQADATGLSRRASGRRWGLAAGLAAAAVLAVAVLWIPGATSPPAPPVMRGESQAIVSLLEPGRALSRQRFDLRWQAALEEPLYEVEVLDADLTVLHRASGLDVPRLRVPAEALAAIEPGAGILWRVEAVAVDGSRYASATFRQRLR